MPLTSSALIAFPLPKRPGQSPPPVSHSDQSLPSYSLRFLEVPCGSLGVSVFTSWFSLRFLEVLYVSVLTCRFSLCFLEVPCGSLGVIVLTCWFSLCFLVVLCGSQYVSVFPLLRRFEFLYWKPFGYIPWVLVGIWILSLLFLLPCQHWSDNQDKALGMILDKHQHRCNRMQSCDCYCTNITCSSVVSVRRNKIYIVIYQLWSGN